MNRQNYAPWEGVGVVGMPQNVDGVFQFGLERAYRGEIDICEVFRIVLGGERPRGVGTRTMVPATHTPSPNPSPRRSSFTRLEVPMLAHEVLKILFWLQPLDGAL